MIQISVTQKENPLILKLSGRLDALTASTFETSVKELLSGHSNCPVFDVENLEYISSAGLRVFLLLINEYESVNKKIGIISPNEMVTEVFEISGIKDYVNVFDSVSEAVSFL
ncbi:MAG: STAS domain-containing protein [Bacteroidales bacterium]|jgi:anti-anti-sigma factor|nr:STAS domain-containing protein [Bacteroidales bacterium]MDY0388342.1 STAS domain-containing protein [Methanolobus sp.]